jgi:hypothetical protein
VTKTTPALRLGLSILFPVVVALSALPLQAAGGTAFSINVKSAFLRSQPGWNAGERTFSVFQGQVYPVLGRTADSAWLRLAANGASGDTWIFAGYGLVSGDLNSVPVVAPAPPAVAATPTAALTLPGTGAAGLFKFTVTVRSLYARGLPSTAGAKVYSLFEGQVYTVLARSADSRWLKLDLRGVQAWVPLGAGTLSGPLAELPVGGAAPAPTATPPPVAGPVLPAVSQRARDIYARGLALGNNPRAFSKIGDCMSVPPFFLAPFDKGEYRLGDAYGYLQDTITNFAGSFARESLVARDGLNVKSVFDPLWTDPTLCPPDDDPLTCEFRLNRPSLAIISLGTNGAWQTNEEYEGYLRQIIAFSISQGVLPILSTKADNLEGGDRFNQVMVKLANEYELPLWNFALAARALPNSGLVDPYHLTWGQAYFDRPGPLTLGWQVRNLTALQALDTVWRGVRQ